MQGSPNGSREFLLCLLYRVTESGSRATTVVMKGEPYPTKNIVCVLGDLDCLQCRVKRCENKP